MFKRFLPRLGLLGFALCFTAEVLTAFEITTETLEDVLAFNSQALGGDENWAKVENIRVQLDIKEPGFEVSGIYVASRAGSMRIDIEAGGERVFAEGLHLDKAWQWSPGDGVHQSSDTGAAALSNSVNAPGRFYTLRQSHERGVQMELLESGDTGEWQVRVRMPNGSEIDHFINKTTGLTTKEQSQRAFHPDLDPTEVTVESINAEPVWVEGVMRFNRKENQVAMTREWLGTTVIRSVEHNIEIPEGYFEAD